jgi:hypothetical protein
MEPASQTKLLTIEEIFTIERRGVIVLPKIPFEAYQGPRSRAVTLRSPDGLETTATATIDIPRVHSGATYYLCLLEGLKKENIEIGTEIWLQNERGEVE